MSPTLHRNMSKIDGNKCKEESKGNKMVTDGGYKKAAYFFNADLTDFIEIQQKFGIFCRK